MTNHLDKFKKKFQKRKPQIQEIAREATSGGIVFRHGQGKDIEILLIQDPKGRWSIPKGHVEEGETDKETAIREIGEEANLKELRVIDRLGKTEFRYRRMKTLVLMTTQVYLVEALGDTDAIKKEEFYANIKWFPFNEALDAIEYEDIGKLMLLGRKKIRQRRG